MAISYKKLFKLMIDKDMKKKDLRTLTRYEKEGFTHINRCELFYITKNGKWRICKSGCA